MVPFGRPKRRVPDVQDDDISLADLPKIRAEINSRRASDGEEYIEAGESSKRSLDAQSSHPGFVGMDGELEQVKRIGEERAISEDGDSFHGRSEYALSVEDRDKKGAMERERWTGRVNEKRDESRFKGICRVAMRHLRFVGPGLVSSVAYFDPGNWTVDLSAGSEFGYKLLSVILMAGIGAAVLQVLSLRLGIATSMSLPAQIRALFLRIREHPRVKPYKWRRRATMAGLYTLYVLAELAIIATDLAELLGSAIALNLIFPELPLYAGVLITAVDVLFVLAFFQRPERGRKGMLAFEGLIVSLVLCVFVCFVILIIQIKPDWREVFKGFVPSSTIIGPKALYTSVGIIGATVMPHALFLGSHLATVDRLDIAPRPPIELSKPLLRRIPGQDLLSMLPERWRPLGQTEKLRRELGYPSNTAHQTQEKTSVPGPAISGGVDRKRVAVDEEVEHMIMKDQARYQAEMNAFDRVKFASIHIGHATIDTVLSLFGFAVTINSSILILAAAAFFYGGNEAVRKAGAEADLFSAHDLIEQQISKPAAFIFALALLCSGQSASITATLAGQVVSEGFIEWKTSPFVRRVITRLLGVIPSVVVAIAVGRDGLTQMLVASQVMLSVVLPFVIFPLVWLCADEKVMMVRNGPSEVDDSQTARGVSMTAVTSEGVRVRSPTQAGSQDDVASAGPPTSKQPATSFSGKLRQLAVMAFMLVRYGSRSPPTVPADEGPKCRSFKSHWSTTAFGYALFSVVTVANAYVLLMLMMGKG